MHKALISLLAAVSFALLVGCDTSCGKRGEPLLWADGITTTNGLRKYETTPIDSTWLHFPSYRRFRLPHGLGTRDTDIVAYLSLAVDKPVPADGGEAQKIALSTSAEVLVAIEDENTVIVENSTCENDYYVFVRVTETAASSTDAGH